MSHHHNKMSFFFAFVPDYINNLANVTETMALSTLKIHIIQKF